MASFDLAVVGAGIAGMAHALAGARRGMRVVVVERDAAASLASVRNFGFVTITGQAEGDTRRRALRSREVWAEVAQAAGIAIHQRGALIVARRAEAMAVLREYAATPMGEGCQLLDASGAVARVPRLRGDVAGALLSPHEIRVEPREALPALAAYLEGDHGVVFHWGLPALSVEEFGVRVPQGRIEAARVVVCAGAAVASFDPLLAQRVALRQCKLQMMRTPVQPRGWTLGPMLAGGLTLRHYEAFAECPSLPALKARVAAEAPELDKYGIHVMASQNGLGEIVLGDSHEYGDEITPFDKREIDELMLRELRKLIDLPDWTIEERWHGIYPKAPGLIQYECQPEPNVEVVIASGGCGMTMSFGFANRLWNRWDMAEGPVRSAPNGRVESPA